MSRRWVLLRGLVREKSHWVHFTEMLQEAFPEDRVVAVDLPGNGSLNHQDSPTSVTAMVEAARQQLLDAQHHGPYTLVAISLGGMIAIEWLRLAPQEVRQAFIINSSLASLSPLWHRLQPANYAGLLRWGVFGRDALNKERYVLDVTSNLRSTEEKEQLARQFSLLPKVSPRNTLRQLCAAARYAAPDALHDVPVTVIRGGGDRLVNPRCSEAIARHWRWPLETHPEAGHDLPLDAPEWLLALLKARVIGD